MLIKSYDGAHTFALPLPYLAALSRLGSRVRMLAWDARALCLDLRLPERAQAWEAALRTLLARMATSPLAAFACAHHAALPPAPPDAGWALWRAQEQQQGLAGQGWALVPNAWCSTYPSHVLLPALLAPLLCADAARHRRRARLPVLTWRRAQAALVRAAEPGLDEGGKGADRALVEAIWTAGGGQSVLVLDCRPRLAALGHALTEGGTEHDYAHTELQFAGIGNIHTMRGAHDALLQLLLKARTDPALDHDFPAQLHKTGWLSHLQTLLEGAHKVAQALEGGRSVLVHCSDGWFASASSFSYTTVFSFSFSCPSFSLGIAPPRSVPSRSCSWTSRREPWRVLRA